MADVIRWAIGYDPRESIALYALQHSIMRRSSMPVSIIPLALSCLSGMLTRPRDPMQSNDFSFSRFLVPWLVNYEGWVVYSDCDMLCRADPARLWALRDDRFAVMCVHHDHQPTETVKYLGERQLAYGRKNWSSLMLLNCRRLRMLSPEYVNSAGGLELHQFQFLRDDLIGWLPASWNHLVGYDGHDPAASLAHWTLGGPYFRGFEDAPFAGEFREVAADLAHVADPAVGS